MTPVLGSKLKLGVYDTGGKRRYWMWLPPVSPASAGQIVLGPIPALRVDEAFTLGWLQIDDEHDRMLLRVEPGMSNTTLAAGDTLQLRRLTISLD